MLENLTDKLQIITNKYTYEELNQLYNSTKYLLLPSKYEGIGLPMIEALICGTFPITCSFVGFVISILAVLFGVTHFPSIYNFSYTCIKSANVLHYLSLTKY